MATQLLTRVIDDGRNLDGLLGTRHGPPMMKTMSASDIALSKAIVTTALRNRGLIEAVFKKIMSRPPPKNARHLLHNLHVAAAQIMFMEVPDSAAVNLAVASLKNDTRSVRFASLANAVLRRLSREKEMLLESFTPEDIARLNMPTWLWKRTKKSFGAQKSSQIAAAHMLEPVIDVTVKSNPDAWAEKLGGIPIFGNSLRVTATGKVESWPGYDDGQWWVQDAAAHLPAHLMGDINGKRVADLCAAPGGKSAQLLNAGAIVTALDASGDRLTRLQQNLDRLKFNAELVESNLFDFTTDAPFDAILLDAPCSSTGTIRRHPDVQWSKTANDISELAQLQFDMILHAAKLLKPGGTLVFSNCSMDREEGEDVLARIISTDCGLEHKPIEATEVYGQSQFINGQGAVRTLPSHLPELGGLANHDKSAQFEGRMGGIDGFFAARFVRT